MARQHSPRQQLREAELIAASLGLRVVERAEPGKARYAVVRGPAECSVEIGARDTPEGVRAFVGRLAWPDDPPRRTHTSRSPQ